MAKAPVKVSTPKRSATKTEKKTKASPPAATGSIDATVLDRLYATINSRKGTDPALSHSARLLSRGKRKIAQKFGEEAVECVIEAVSGTHPELVGESADVLYHLLVIWVDAGIDPAEIWGELRRRESMSGVEEKASRPTKKGLGS